MPGWIKLFGRRSRAFVAFATLVILIVVGVVDYTTGWELSFSVFYLLLVVLASWFAGKRVASFRHGAAHYVSSGQNDWGDLRSAARGRRRNNHLVGAA